MMATMSSRRSFRVLLVTLAVTAPILAACSDTTARDNELDPEEELDQAVEELVAMPGGPPGAIVVDAARFGSVGPHRWCGRAGDG